MPAPISYWADLWVAHPRCLAAAKAADAPTATVTATSPSRTLYPRLIDSEDDEISAAGEAFKDEMGGLAPAFIACADKWTATSIPADWEGYRCDTPGLVDALTDRLARENRELLPMLERLDRAA